MNKLATFKNNYKLINKIAKILTNYIALKPTS